ncbi:MAG: NAD-binding D-isomer specific 2-hydroxyacid dehydrogenase [Firmicutes bacterium]|nr:NAD-binding D-isomer specific 2-hydroxyacid dehydrogenase [Bacillota bacterium]
MNKPKVYVTDSEFPDNSYEETVITATGGELLGLQCKTEEEVIAQCHDAIGLINQYAPITRRVLESLPNLKVVSRMGIGVNTIDVEAATELGICVSNVPDASVEEVSNHALALLMAFARKITQFNDSVKLDGQWGIKAAIPIRRLGGQKLGLLSFGQIAQRLAAKASVLGLDLLVYDPYVSASVAEKYGAKLVALEELLAEADFISIHTPHTKETEHLIGKQELRRMKSNAVIINTGRGPIIDEQALIKALQEGWIAGAGLDVLEVEPLPPQSPLIDMKNVIITPHAGWYSEEALVEIRTKTARGVAEVLQGGGPKYLVNKGVTPRKG